MAEFRLVSISQLSADAVETLKRDNDGCVNCGDNAVSHCFVGPTRLMAVCQDCAESLVGWILENITDAMQRKHFYLN